MSSWPGGDLEDYLMYEYDLIVGDENKANPSLRIAEALGVATRRIVVTKEQFKPLVDLCEPHRECVEYRLSVFDEETQSWRMYGSYVLDCIPSEIQTQMDVIVKGYRNEANPNNSSEGNS